MLRLAADLAVFLTAVAVASYRPFISAELVGGADLIVVATITSLAGDTFEAEVSAGGLGCGCAARKCAGLGKRLTTIANQGVDHGASRGCRT